MKKVVLIVVIILLIPLIVYGSDIVVANSVVDTLLNEAGDLKDSGYEAIQGNLNFNDICTYVLDLFVGEIRNIVTKLPVLLTLLILFGIKNSMDFGSSINQAVSLGCFSVVALISSGIFSELFLVATNMIGELSKFIYLSIPALTGLISTTGMVVSGGKGAFIILGFMNVLTYLINNFFTPLILLYFIFTIISAMLENDMFSSAKNAMKSIVKVFLPTILGLFTALLSIFMTVSQKTDAFFLRSAKMAIGNLIPFLGGALSESTELVLNSVVQIKSQAGIASIIVMIYIFLVPIIKVLSGIVAFKFLSVIACFLSDQKMTSYYDDLTACLAIIGGVMGTMAVLMVICIVILIGV